MAIGTMAKQIMTQEGLGGFYRGFLPSAVKNLPNKGALGPCYDNIGIRVLIKIAWQCPGCVSLGDSDG